MFQKANAKPISFSHIALVCVFALMMLLTFSSVSYAVTGITGDAVDYLNAPAVGPNVVAYMFAENSSLVTNFNLFVRRCECLKRLPDMADGVLLSYPQTMDADTFGALNSTAFTGYVDPDGQLSTALGGAPGLIAVVERVLEFQKINNKLVARLSVKFVTEAP